MLRPLARPLMLLIAALMISTPALAQTAEQARTFFYRYQSGERAFDPDVADLYCETALVRNTRIYPDGRRRVIEIPAPRYKSLVRSAMPIAQARGDYITYSEVKYAQEGKAIRVTATRYSVLKKYSSPISLLIGACNGNGWSILEEISESRP